MDRIIGIDFGRKRTGLAVSDPLGIFASALDTIPSAKIIEYFKNYAATERIVRFVVGYPRNMDGKPSEAAADVDAFLHLLAKHFPDIPVELEDERFTSVLAHRAMIDGGMKKSDRRDKASVDKISAAYFRAAGLDSASSNLSKSLEPFPKGRPRDGVAALSGLSASLCVSFSGLKTSLLRFVQQHDSLVNPPADAKMLPDSPFEGVTLEQARVVASYQEAIVQSVAERTRFALGRRDYRALILGGGVSLNSRMRTVLSSVARKCGVPLLMAKPKYCGDNGAMIAGLAFYRRAHEGEDALRIDVRPSLEAGES